MPQELDLRPIEEEELDLQPLDLQPVVQSKSESVKKTADTTTIPSRFDTYKHKAAELLFGSDEDKRRGVIGGTPGENTIFPKAFNWLADKVPNADGPLTKTGLTASIGLKGALHLLGAISGNPLGGVKGEAETVAKGIIPELIQDVPKPKPRLALPEAKIPRVFQAGEKGPATQIEKPILGNERKPIVDITPTKSGFSKAEPVPVSRFGKPTKFKPEPELDLQPVAKTTKAGADIVDTVTGEILPEAPVKMNLNPAVRSGRGKKVVQTHMTGVEQVKRINPVTGKPELPKFNPDDFNPADFHVVTKKTQGVAPNQRARIIRGMHDPVDIFFDTPESRYLFGSGQKLGNKANSSELMQRFRQSTQDVINKYKLSEEDARKAIMGYNEHIRQLANELPKSAESGIIGDLNIKAPSFKEFIGKTGTKERLKELIKGEEGGLDLQRIKEVFNEEGLPSQIWNAPKEMMATDLPWTTSASWRQANMYIGTKAWKEGIVQSAKVYRNKALADMLETKQLSKPLFKPQYQQVLKADGTPKVINGRQVIKELPSVAERHGLRRGLFDERGVKSIVERIPIYGEHLKGSNRQFKMMTNHIGDNLYEQMVDDFTKLGKDPRQDDVLGKKIADFVNVTLKRGNVAPERLDKAVNMIASQIMWSPRNVASELQMPKLFFSSEPKIRQAYLAGMGRKLGMWMGIAGAASLAGADVSLNPTNPDFGKIKIGPHRIDLPGGLQQFIVFISQQLAGGKTSSNTGRFTKFGQGYKPETRTSAAGQFAANRLHPSIDYFRDLGNATEKDPVGVIDRTLQLVNPMFNSDIKKVLETNPELYPMLSLINSLGAGTQSYEKGEKFNESKILPKSLQKYDITLGGR